MTYRRDEAWDEEADESDEDASGSGWISRILIVAVLAGTGSGSALLWRAAGGGPLFSQSAVLAVPPTAVAEKTATQAEIDALRQQVTGLNQSAQQLLGAQQAEIKRLSDQVATLSGKLEMMQRPVTSANASIVPAKPSAPPAPARKKPEGAKPVAAAKPEPKPVDTRPTGAVSTGGAPLPLTR